MAGREIIVQTVTGLGYDVVEIVHAGGILRVTIDWPWVSPAAGTQDALSERFVTIEDCETVTRQLQYALEVDNIPYQRLEVSSPGIDRLLRCDQDFERFTGCTVDITLKSPVGGATGLVHASRKKFRGVLQRVTPALPADLTASDGDSSTDQPATDQLCEQQFDQQFDRKIHWQIVWHDEPSVKPGQKVSKKRLLAPTLSLGFVLSDLKEARLAPIVSFKGKPPALGTGHAHLADLADLADFADRPTRASSVTELNTARVGIRPTPIELTRRVMA